MNKKELSEKSDPVYDADGSYDDETFKKCSLMVERYLKFYVHDLEDVYNLRQEVMLTVLEKLSTSYHEEGHFLGWVSVITLNMVREYYRKLKKAPLVISLEDCDMLEYIPSRYSRKGELLRYEGVHGVLMEELQQLDPFCRKLIESIFFQNNSFGKAARQLSVSKSTCFKRCQKLLKTIRLRLMERGITIHSLSGDEWV